MNIEEIQIGDMIFYAGDTYQVADIKHLPGNLQMIGIYDEPPTKHIDYLNPNQVI